MKTLMADQVSSILDQIIDSECSDYIQSEKVGVGFKPTYTEGLIKISKVIREMTSLPKEAMVVLYGSTHVLEVAPHGTCVYRLRRSRSMSRRLVLQNLDNVQRNKLCQD